MKRVVSGMVLTLLLTSMLTLAFNIQPVKSDYVWTETIYVLADGSIQPSTAPISSVDNVTYKLTDNIAGNVPQSSNAMVIERNNIIIDGAGYTVTGSGSGYGITLADRSNVTVRKMTIKNFYYGILLSYSSDNVLSGNTVTANKEYGIALGSSSDNSVSRNNITNNWDGILLDHSSSNNSLSGNNITNNQYGIYLFSSSNYNNVSGNNITANNEYGIVLDFSSSNNSISRNTIARNKYGIGLAISSNNTIYHNNFINNTSHFYSVGGSTNVWDDGYPSGGNYWSDYAGVDEKKGISQDEPGSDDLGDTPYVIDVDQDHYPLMYQWRELLGDVNGDGTVDMQDIGLLADAFLAEPGHPLWNAGADINNDNRIDMADISIAIDHFMQS